MITNNVTKFKETVGDNSVCILITDGQIDKMFINGKDIGAYVVIKPEDVERLCQVMQSVLKAAQALTEDKDNE